MYLLQQLQNIQQSLHGIIPEIFLTLFLVSLPVWELIFNRYFGKDRSATLVQLSSFAGGIVFLILLAANWNTRSTFLFENFLFLDQKAMYFKGLAAVLWILALFHIRLVKYRFPAEVYSLIAAVILGVSILSMSTHLLSIYLSVELISLSSYLLVAISPGKKATEGGLKYLLYGSVSSAIMLYGISFVYGLTGSLNVADPALLEGLQNNPTYTTLLVSILLFGGLFFKLALVPFHIWAPDVYEATPTPLVSFLSVAPKAGVLIALIRIVSSFPEVAFVLLAGVALLSMTFGNVGALAQQNFKRLMAYSSIAQAGYLLVGVVAYSQTGMESAAFYLSVYSLLNMAAFILADILIPQSDTLLSQFAGMGKSHVITGIAVITIMAALTGLPPTAGFTSKWLVFTALLESWQKVPATWKLWLLVGGVLNAAISLAYYLKLPYLLFFKSSSESSNNPIETTEKRIVAVAIILFVILFFIKPETILALIHVV